MSIVLQPPISFHTLGGDGVVASPDGALLKPDSQRLCHLYDRHAYLFVEIRGARLARAAAVDGHAQHANELECGVPARMLNTSAILDLADDERGEPSAPLRAHFTCRANFRARRIGTPGQETVGRGLRRGKFRDFFTFEMGRRRISREIELTRRLNPLLVLHRG
jgi:hypothetical protein